MIDWDDQSAREQLINSRARDGHAMLTALDGRRRADRQGGATPGHRTGPGHHRRRRRLFPDCAWRCDRPGHLQTIAARCPANRSVRTGACACTGCMAVHVDGDGWCPSPPAGVVASGSAGLWVTGLWSGKRPRVIESVVACVIDSFDDQWLRQMLGVRDSFPEAAEFAVDFGNIRSDGRNIGCDVLYLGALPGVRAESMPPMSVMSQFL